jgi:hypothetical protein
VKIFADFAGEDFAAEGRPCNMQELTAWPSTVPLAAGSSIAPTKGFREPFKRGGKGR